MPILILGALVLLLALCLSFIWRGRGSSMEAKTAVLRWYRARKQEIKSEPILATENKQQLLDELETRVLEDIDADPDGPQAQLQPGGGEVLAWLKPVLIMVLFCAAIIVYWFLGGAKDVFIAEELAGIDSNTDAAGIAKVIGQIEDRVRTTPDNAHYWALLARYYTAGERHLEALQAYEELLRLGPNDASALALAAQSEYLIQQRSLSARATKRAERALEIDPMQVTALGLLGMAAFEQENFPLAIEYWQRLLSDRHSQSASRAVIEQGIARARAQLAQQGADQPEEQLLPAIVVQVRLAEGSTAKAADTVFVLARVPGERMPIAVKKYTVADLPVEVRIDDNDSMLAGRKLSAQASVEIVAQVSPSGRPGQQYSIMEAMAGPVKAAVEAPRLLLDLASSQ